MIQMFMTLGNLYYYKKEYEKAILYYRRAIMLLEKEREKEDTLESEFDREQLENLYYNISLAQMKIKEK